MWVLNNFPIVKQKRQRSHLLSNGIQSGDLKDQTVAMGSNRATAMLGDRGGVYALLWG